MNGFSEQASIFPKLYNFNSGLAVLEFGGEMLKQKSWKNTVVDLPHGFQDSSSLVSQMQKLWSAQTQEPSPGTVHCCHRGCLYTLLVTNTVVSFFVLFCIFTLKFPFY